MNGLAAILPHTDPMPVLFIGHGSPMNAIEDNDFSRGWHEVAATLPRPHAILCISAHWETRGTLVTAMPRPATIHDFGGFPQALYDVQYEAPGSPALAEEARSTVKRVAVGMDNDWGLDHGCWSVLRRMYPAADVPVIQLSLNYTQAAQYHYGLAKELAPLRERGVLILGSGNMVHNLRRVVLPNRSVDDFNTPFGLDWALDARGAVQGIDRSAGSPTADRLSYARPLGCAGRAYPGALPAHVVRIGPAGRPGRALLLQRPARCRFADHDLPEDRAQPLT